MNYGVMNSVFIPVLICALPIKYKNVVSRVKFRPQSARMVVDDAQKIHLDKNEHMFYY